MLLALGDSTTTQKNNQPRLIIFLCCCKVADIFSVSYHYNRQDLHEVFFVN